MIFRSLLILAAISFAPASNPVHASEGDAGVIRRPLNLRNVASDKIQEIDKLVSEASNKFARAMSSARSIREVTDALVSAQDTINEAIKIGRDALDGDLAPFSKEFIDRISGANLSLQRIQSIAQMKFDQAHQKGVTSTNPSAQATASGSTA